MACLRVLRALRAWRAHVFAVLVGSRALRASGALRARVLGVLGMPHEMACFKK